MAVLIDEDPHKQGTFVFIIGVSRYPHLDDGPDATEHGVQSGLRQLTSAARSAAAFSKWILEEHRDPAAPLLYVEEFLSPSERELSELRERPRGKQPDAPTREQIKTAWRSFQDRVRGKQDSKIIVYLTGHGVMASPTATHLLLQDFGKDGENRLWGSLDIVSMFQSVTGTEFPDRQFWFADCCRTEKDAESVQDGLRFDSAEGSSTRASLYFSTGVREAAWAEIDGRSLFSECLSKCLEVAAASHNDGATGWQVNSDTLRQTLFGLVREMSGSSKQTIEQFGLPEPKVVFHEYDPKHLPKVDAMITSDATAKAKTWIIGEDERINVPSWPLERKMSIGSWSVSADPPYAYRPRTITISPQRSAFKVSPKLDIRLGASKSIDFVDESAGSIKVKISGIPGLPRGELHNSFTIEIRDTVTVQPHRRS